MFPIEIINEQIYFTHKIHSLWDLFIFSVRDSSSFSYFNKKYFTQTDGLAMGSPISGILAEIIISHLAHILNKNKNKYAHSVYWY